MTAAEFKSWREDMGFTQEAVALKLGYTVRSIRNFENGSRPIPPAVRLACRALSKGWDDG